MTFVSFIHQKSAPFIILTKITAPETSHGVPHEFFSKQVLLMVKLKYFITIQKENLLHNNIKKEKHLGGELNFKSKHNS